jgi:hypothetical protein
MKSMLLLTLLPACVIAGRSLPEMHRSAVAQRASYDFSCESERIVVQDVGGNSYAAEGCGQTQVYSCSGTSETCVRDSNALPPEDPPPPPYVRPGSRTP